MNRLYLIIPILLLAVFGGYYWNYSKHASAIAEQKVAEAARQEMEEAAEQEAIARKAREDAEERAAEREAAELAKEAERQAAWEADSQKIAEDTERYLEQAEQNQQKVQSLEAELASLQDRLDTAKTQAFDLRREIELRKIDRRNATLEQQRLLSMIEDKYESLLRAPHSPNPETTP